MTARAARSNTNAHEPSRKTLLLELGCEFFEGMPKHRYVGIYGDRRTKRILLESHDLKPWREKNVVRGKVG